MTDDPMESDPMLPSLVSQKPDHGTNGSKDVASISINRPAYTQNAMASTYDIRWADKMTLGAKMKQSLVGQLACTPVYWKERLLQFFPFINIMRSYQWKRWLYLDLMSGISVGVIHIPQGMGFSLLTSVPPVCGLYSSFFQMLIYFFFGTSRHISMGTMALISLMIGAVVNREVDKLGLAIPVGGQNNTILANDTLAMQQRIDEVRIGTAVSVSLLVGCFQFVMGMTGLGTVATFMSMPFIGSFLTGATVHMITSQVPAVFGLTTRGYPGIFKLPMAYYEIFSHIRTTNICSLVTALLCLFVLVIVKEVINKRFRMKVPIPAELLVVLVATLTSHYCRLHDSYGLQIIGPIPAGLPSPRIPPMNNAPTYIVDAVIIAVISFAISISMAKLMAKKHDYSIDINQELHAYGLCHGISSFFNCFAGAQAPPRTLVHDSIGGKTQVNSLFACLMLLLVCLFLGKLFYSLPMAVLSAIIIVALMPMFREFKELPTLWRVNKCDFSVWIITFLSVVILDVTTGLIIGMAASIFVVVLQAHSAVGSSLVSISGSGIYMAKGSVMSSNILEYPGLAVFRFGAPLFFVNVETFKTQLYEKVVNCQKLPENIAPQIITMGQMDADKNMHYTNGMSKSTRINETTSCKSGFELDVVASTISESSADKHRLHAIILDCATISYIDIMGVNMLNAIRTDLQNQQVVFSLACVPRDMCDKLEAAGSITRVDDEKTTMFTVYPTVQDAIAMEARNTQ